nr:flagellar biosynthesis protein FlgC [Desulfobulbaceae bacterium]
MVTGIYSGLSALRSIQVKTQTTANNVANINTDGFKKSRATLVEGNPQGVNVTISKIETPGPQLYEQTPKGTELIEKSNVDLTEEIPSMMLSKRAFQANIKTIQAEDEMLGMLLDIKS